MSRSRLIRSLPLALLLAMLFVVQVYAIPGDISLVSVATDGTQGNWNSFSPSISADGCYVAFHSLADNLVAGDTNENPDIFIHNCLTNETALISVASDGTQGNEYSMDPSISADGRYVAFWSYASNLVSEDTNGVNDAFVHDRLTGETVRISVASDGLQGNDSSMFPSISTDGRYVAFVSNADNLVAEDTNGSTDIFVHDVVTGETTRVSITTEGIQANYYSDAPTISADGRYVVFASYANNLAAEDPNAHWDIFVHDRISGETTLASVASNGIIGNGDSLSPSISDDGRYVAFYSSANNLVTGDTNGEEDVFVNDRTTGRTIRVSVASDGKQGNGDSMYPTISADGRFVAFFSAADNLATGDANGYNDIFVHDLLLAETANISVSSDGTHGDMVSLFPSISADGHYVAFHSKATNLVVGDTNGYSDVFVHEMDVSVIYVISGNAGIPNVVLNYSDRGSRAVMTSENGDYSFAVPSGWSGTVTPLKKGYLFTPTSLSYVNVQADQSNQDFTPIIAFTISGNAGGVGVRLTYMTDIIRAVISDKKGNYSFVVPQGWSGTVVPSKQCGSRNSLARCYFTPSRRVYTDVQMDQGQQNYKLKRVY